MWMHQEKRESNVDHPITHRASENVLGWKHQTNYSGSVKLPMSKISNCNTKIQKKYPFTKGISEHIKEMSNEHRKPLATNYIS
jgi:hypothetical protein